MSCHAETVALGRGESILLLGHPNVGKSALFHALTGSFVTISNYPGTTISLSRSILALEENRWPIYDAPGVHSLIPISEDERIARDALLAPGTARVLLVLDAKDARRGIALAVELAEAGRPFAIALNMEDEAEALGIRLDAEAIEARLGIPVVPTVATRSRGVEALRAALARASLPACPMRYPEPVGEALAEIERRLGPSLPGRRLIALSLLAGDRTAERHLASPLTTEDREAIEALCRWEEGGSGAQGGRRLGAIYAPLDMSSLSVRQKALSIPSIGRPGR